MPTHHQKGGGEHSSSNFREFLTFGAESYIIINGRKKCGVSGLKNGTH